MGNAEKPAKMTVQTRRESEIGPVFFRELFAQMKPDFVDHTTEMVQPPDLFSGRAKGWIKHALREKLPWASVAGFRPVSQHPFQAPHVIVLSHVPQRGDDSRRDFFGVSDLFWRGIVPMNDS